MKPSLVFDSSVTLSLAFRDEYDAYSVNVFEAVRQNGAIVPDIWPLEVANILSNGISRGRLLEPKAKQFLSLLRELPIQISRVGDFGAAAAVEAMFSLSRQHALTAYDAAYLQLAMATGLPIASKDNQLNAAAKAAGVQLFA